MPSPLLSSYKPDPVTYYRNCTMSTRQELYHEHAVVHVHSFMGENTTEIFFFNVRAHFPNLHYASSYPLSTDLK